MRTARHRRRAGPEQVTRSRPAVFQTGYAGSIPVARSDNEGPGQPGVEDLGL
ncbi:MAG: hypothetical protein JWL97_3574 [Gemmatimonadales bacterium]|nr:hypothetical protein [Gemmatimonadales bacterium]